MFARLQKFLKELASFSENKPGDKFSGILRLDNEMLEKILDNQKKKSKSDASFKLNPKIIAVNFSDNELTAYYQDGEEIVNKPLTNVLSLDSGENSVVSEINEIKNGHISYERNLLKTITDVIYPAVSEEHVIEMPDVRTPKPLKYYLNRCLDLLATTLNFNKKDDKSSTNESNEPTEPKEPTEHSVKMNENFVPPSIGPLGVEIIKEKSSNNAQKKSKNEKTDVEVKKKVKAEKKLTEEPTPFYYWVFKGFFSKPNAPKAAAVQQSTSTAKITPGFDIPGRINHSLMFNKSEYNKFSKNISEKNKKSIGMLIGPEFYGIKFKI